MDMSNSVRHVFRRGPTQLPSVGPQSRWTLVHLIVSDASTGDRRENRIGSLRQVIDKCHEKVRADRLLDRQLTGRLPFAP